MWLVTLPMGWTNSVPIFHDDVCHILQPEIPTYTIPYINDIPVKSPLTCYILPDSSCKTLATNLGIQHFMWEHFQNINCIVQHMKYSGSTFSGTKSMLCIKNFIIISNYCTPDGRKPDCGKVNIIHNWGPCHTLSEVSTHIHWYSWPNAHLHLQLCTLH